MIDDCLLQQIGQSEATFVPLTPQQEAEITRICALLAPLGYSGDEMEVHTDDGPRSPLLIAWTSAAMDHFAAVVRLYTALYGFIRLYTRYTVL